MSLPFSLSDVERCPCHYCVLLRYVMRDCQQRHHRYFIHDTRMFGQGFSIVDLAKLFKKPAAIHKGFRWEVSAAEFIHHTFQQNAAHSLCKFPAGPFVTWQHRFFLTEEPRT